MTNMVSILNGQEEEMMRIGSNKKESRTGPENPSHALCSSYPTATANAPVARSNQTDDYKNQRQIQIGQTVLRKQTRPICGWVAPIEVDSGKPQTHLLPDPESTEPHDSTGTPDHYAPTQIHNICRGEAPVKNPENVASSSIEHDAAKDVWLPPGEDMCEHATGRGNVDPFATQLNAAMGRQPSPEWDSCEPGK